MSKKVKLYKGRYFFIFYEQNDEDVYGLFDNVKEIVARMKKLHTFPINVRVDENNNLIKTDVNLTPITREEVTFVSNKLRRSLMREKNRRHLINLFGRQMRVYLADTFDDDEEDLVS